VDAWGQRGIDGWVRELSRLAELLETAADGGLRADAGLSDISDAPFLPFCR
jgi:hypothetical protein